MQHRVVGDSRGLNLSGKGAFFYLCQAVSGIDFISISQPSVNKAECLMHSETVEKAICETTSLARWIFLDSNNIFQKLFLLFWKLYFIFRNGFHQQNSLGKTIVCDFFYIMNNDLVFRVHHGLPIIALNGTVGRHHLSRFIICDIAFEFFPCCTDSCIIVF